MIAAPPKSATAPVLLLAVLNWLLADEAIEEAFETTHDACDAGDGGEIAARELEAEVDVEVLVLVVHWNSAVVSYGMCSCCCEREIGGRERTRTVEARDRMMACLNWIFAVGCVMSGFEKGMVC